MSLKYCQILADNVLRKDFYKYKLYEWFWIFEIVAIQLNKIPLFILFICLIIILILTNKTSAGQVIMWLTMVLDQNLKDFN